MTSVLTLLLLLLLMVVLVEMAAITALSTVVAIVTVHDGIGPTATRTSRVIHNLGLMVLELIEVGHTTTTQASNFLAARVVIT